MIKRVSESMFIEEMKDEKFSIEGLKLLYDHLEWEDPEYELDVIELRCTWSEYQFDEEHLENDFGHFLESYTEWCENNSERIEDLEYNDIRRLYYHDLIEVLAEETIVLDYVNGCVIQEF